MNYVLKFREPGDERMADIYRTNLIASVPQLLAERDALRAASAKEARRERSENQT